MIKFFRHIRQNMINENRFSKYLLYAVGEIVLVVIGILIALNINNWNTDRQLRKEEVKYLKKLKTDLQADLVTLNKLIGERNDKVTSALDLLESPAPNNQKELIAMDSLIGILYYWKEYIPRTNTLQELTSSGKFSILRNDSIKTLLLELEAKNRFEAMGNAHLKREFHEYLYDRATALRERTPMVDLRATVAARNRVYRTNVTPEELDVYYTQAKAFLSDLTLRNGLKLAVGNNYFLIGLYEELVRETKRLIVFIDEDLAKE